MKVNNSMEVDGDSLNQTIASLMKMHDDDLRDLHQNFILGVTGK